MSHKVDGLTLTKNDRRVLADIVSVCERIDGYMPHGSSDHVAIRRLEDAGLVVCEGIAECEECDAHEGGYFILTDAGKAQL